MHWVIDVVLLADNDVHPKRTLDAYRANVRVLRVDIGSAASAEFEKLRNDSERVGQMLARERESAAARDRERTARKKRAAGEAASKADERHATDVAREAVWRQLHAM